ncbi:MAG: hypothetical protein Q8S01_12590 [Ignavibacteria bacterium]|nr:hypothetical protein [Ignavibacteria bacterium]
MRYLLVLIVVLCLASTANAQVSFGLSFNLNSQPAWGPTGNDYAEFYYLPDIEVYYNVPLHRFYYNDRGRWRYSVNLPYRYRNFNLYNSYKVVVNERNPWRNHNDYREKYANYRDRHDQQSIRDSRDSKYFANKNHPEHNNWVKQQKNDNGKDRGENRDNKSDHKKNGGQGKHKK